MKSRAGSSRRPSAGKPSPFWAIAQADLKGLFRSRITYGWLLAAVFIQVVRTLGSASSGTTSSVVSSGLSDFVYVWSLVITVLAASSVSSEAGELADSILSKSVTRLDYVLAKFASRIAYTLICFSMVSAVLVGLALRLEVGDYSAIGLASAVLLVALAMVTLTALGVALSIALPSTVVAIVALLVLWYSMTILFPVVGLGFVSPGSMLGDLPGVITGAWGGGEWETAGGFIAISVVSLALSSAYFHSKDI
ncbi:MAG TPA: ABC transporter permease subunit [Nitrososphaerales archaeon]|nr:ABC transporter permease subunit [Nitrososphaerales archaeon]